MFCSILIALSQNLCKRLPVEFLSECHFVGIAMERKPMRFAVWVNPMHAAVNDKILC